MTVRRQHKNIVVYLVVLSIFIFFHTDIIHAQENLLLGNIDTLTLKKGDKLILTDTNFVFTNDTIIYVPSSTKYRIKKNPETKSEEFYKKIEQKSSGKKWSAEIYRLVFKTPSSSKKQIKIVDKNTELQYSKYSGYYIKSIRIKKIDVFGPSVFDTNLVAETWITRNINNFHINTRISIIQKSLLFSEGAPLEPIDIYDSERIIRSLPYIHDVKIIVNPDVSGNYVNIIVVTQDVWTLGVEIEMTELNSAKFDVYDKNIAGIGHQLNNTIYYDSQDDSYNGYNGYYRIKNQFGQFINSELNYYNRKDVETVKLSASRDFVSPQIKYAGGIILEQTGLPPVILTSREKSIIEANIKYNYTDVWIARGVDLKRKTFKNPRVTRIIVGGRIIKKNFLDRPQVSPDSNSTYYNYTHFLGNIGFSKRNYYKSNLIYNYGRTEDIPNGYKVNFILGTSIDDFYEKIYTGISLSSGNYINNFGYYYTNLAVGGFISNRQMQQGILDLKFNYFTPLQKLGNYSVRNFINTNLTYGINRSSSDLLNINKTNGIRDFVVDTLTGTNRFKVSIEALNFTPLHILGFRFVFFGFVDIATIGNTSGFLFTNKYYSGLGLGFRIRNDNLVFRTFEIKFVYFPELPADRPQSIFYFSNEKQIDFYDFSVAAPGFFTYD